MKLISFLLIVVSALACVQSKNIQSGVPGIPADSLKKYSYLISVITDQPRAGVYQPMGTGFFMRLKDRLYLITARHVLTDCSGERHKLKKIFVLIEDSNHLPMSAVTVDPRLITDTMPCVGFNDVPDAMAIEIDPASKVNSVEQFIRQPFKKVESIGIYGFPGIKMLRYEESTSYEQASHLAFKGSETTFLQMTDSLGTVRKYSGYIENAAVSAVSTLRGYSGSPVFFQDKKSKSWRLGGVICTVSGRDSVTKRALEYVRIEYLTTKIRNQAK